MPAVELEDKPQTFAAFEGKISGNVIKGVSLIHEGPALGHKHHGYQIIVDDKSMREFERIAKAQKRIKVKFNHGGIVQDAVGYVENFRRRGKKLLGDVTVLNAHPSRELLLEMVETISDAFGISLVFHYGEYDWVEDQESFAVRPEQILSADFVDQPAANPTGLFALEIDKAEDDMPKASESTDKPEAFDAQAAIVALTEQVKALQDALAAKPADQPKDEPAPAPVPDAALGSKIDELAALVKAFAAAPATKQESAPVNEPEAFTPPQSYADARAAAIGNKTGLQRIAAARAFDSKFASEAAYLTSFKK